MRLASIRADTCAGSLSLPYAGSRSLPSKNWSVSCTSHSIQARPSEQPCEGYATIGPL